MKMQYDYYTQTEGFPDVKISLNLAIELVQRFRDMERAVIITALKDGEIIECSDKVKVWAEEAIIYNKI